MGISSAQTCRRIKPCFSILNRTSLLNDEVYMQKTLLVLVLFLFSPIYAEKIAYVDLDQILIASEEGKKAKTQFDKEVKVKEEELKKLEDALKKKAEEFEKKKTILNPEGQKQEEKNMQIEFMRLQQMRQKYFEEMKEREKELLSPLVERVRKIIEHTAAAEKYSFVFEKKASFIIYADDKLDLTSMVVKKLNEKMKVNLNRS